MWAMKANDMGIWKKDRDPNLPLVESITKAAAKHKNNPKIKAMEGIVMGYDPEKSNKMSIGDYHREIAETIRHTHDEVDWEKMRTWFHLSSAQHAFLRRAERFIDSQTLLAFNLSELMPSGALAYDLFDTILKTGGVEFVFRIPSGGDLKMSYGPGQLTERVFENGKEDKGSIVRMKGVLKHHLLPEDIAHIRGAHHHIASYLNAIFNLVVLTQSLSDKEAIALMNEPIGDDLRLYISGAHNHPSGALTSFHDFAAAYATSKREASALRHNYTAFCTPSIGPYVERSMGNLL